MVTTTTMGTTSHQEVGIISVFSVFFSVQITGSRVIIDCFTVSLQSPSVVWGTVSHWENSNRFSRPLSGLEKRLEFSPVPWNAVHYSLLKIHCRWLLPNHYLDQPIAKVVMSHTPVLKLPRLWNCLALSLSLEAGTTLCQNTVCDSSLSSRWIDFF